jgi:hypothetical protein
MRPSAGRPAWRFTPMSERHAVLSVARRSVLPVASVRTFELTAQLWRYPGADGWYFVSLPPEISADVSDITASLRRGFGSVRVVVTVGGSSWRTSIFPDSKTGTYLLPVKKAVRVAEHLQAGDEVRAQLQITDL